MKFFWCLLICVGLLVPGYVLADNISSLGDMADSLMEPLSIVSDFISSAAIIIGASFLFAAIIKYRQYRDNPLFAPISTVIILIIMGILLISLPLTYKLLETDITQELHHDKK